MEKQKFYVKGLILSRGFICWHYSGVEGWKSHRRTRMRRPLSIGAVMREFCFYFVFIPVVGSY